MHDIRDVLNVAVRRAARERASCMTSVALCVPRGVGSKLQRFHQPERLYVIALWQRGQHKLQRLSNGELH